MICLKKVVVIIITGIFTFVSCFALNNYLSDIKQISSSTSSNRVNLVIDAGHGGMDAGTVGVDGALEKNINLDIALMLYDFAMVSGVECFLIRDGDHLVYNSTDDKKRSDLYNRLDYVNSIDNSCLISIHQNHFEDAGEWGMQVWYSPNDDSSKIIADNILKITKSNLQPQNTRLNKRSDSSYYLLYKASVPSVMVECGFMSNPDENKNLQDSFYQAKLAYSIMLGFADYISKEL